MDTVDSPSGFLDQSPNIKEVFSGELCYIGAGPYLGQLLKAWTLRGTGKCAKVSLPLSSSKASECSTAYREVSVAPEGEKS